MKARYTSVAVLVITVMLLDGCSSVRLSYNHADLLLRSMADSYLGLTDEQAADLKLRLARFHDWHREQELPHYAVLAHTAGEKLSDGLTRDEVTWAMTAVQERARVLAGQVADDLAPLLASLDPAQLDAMEKKFAKDNVKFAKKYLMGDESRRLRARAEQLSGLFSDWVGRLDSEQRRLIEDTAGKFLIFYDLRFKERQRRQQDFVELLRENRAVLALRPKLRAFLVDWEAGYGADYAQVRWAYQESLVQLVLDLDRTLTPAQRRQAVTRFASFADDFRKLVSEKMMANFPRPALSR